MLMKKVLFTILFSATVLMSALGQGLGPWPFVVPMPGLPPIVGNMEAVKSNYKYTAKIALGDVKGQEALNKAEKTIIESLANILGISALSEKESDKLENFSKIGYIVKKGNEGGKSYVSIRFPMQKGQDVCNGMWNAVSNKCPNVFLTTLTMTVSGDELEMTFSDFNGCAIVLMDELGNIGFVKGMNEEWEKDHSKPFMRSTTSQTGNGISVSKSKNINPADTMFYWDMKQILTSHGPIGCKGCYEPTNIEQFNIYEEALKNGSAEFITKADVIEDLEIQEKTLWPIVQELNKAVEAKDKETIKSCNERIEILLNRYDYLGYNVYSWPKNTIPQFFTNQYYNLTAIRDSNAVIGVNLNIFERYIEPIYNTMIVLVKGSVGDHVVSVYYNDLPQYLYNPKSKLAEPADKKDAKRWASYKREISKL